MKKCGIYKITNPKGKIYIGQSINIEKRFREYRYLGCKTQQLLYRSLFKYGIEKHLFEILIECLESELNDKERYYQDLYSAVGKNGLNLKLTTANDRSGSLSQEVKDKIGSAHKGVPKKKESIEKGKISLQKRYDEGFVNPRKGAVPSLEMREKLSKIRSGSKLSDDHKESIRLSLLGHKRLVGRKLSESHKENCRLNATKHHSKLVLDTVNGIFYESAKELSDLSGLVHSTLRSRLNGSFKNNTNYIYV